MLTKKQFYMALKQNTNRYQKFNHIIRFEDKGIKCLLSFGITSKFIPNTQKSEWYIDAQLKNDADVPLSKKYIAKDLYGKLVDFGSSEPFKLF